MKMELIHKLQMYVKQRSVDELKSVRVDELKLYLQVDDILLKGLIDELEEKGVLTYKYNIRCPECKTFHTVYQNEIRKKVKICDICEETIVFEKLLKGSNLLIMLDKQEVLALSEPIDWKRDALSKVINLASIQSIKKEEKQKESKMKIFIGSSKEAKDTGELRTIATILEEFKHTPIKWCDTGVFYAGEYTFDCLAEKADEVDAAIFIFKADDKTWYREDIISSVRDNVILEYGLFSGKLGRQKVAMIYSGNPATISDLQGLIRYSLDTGKNKLEEELEAWLKRIQK